MSVHSDKPILLGQISGLYGVQGWVKIFSYTSPRENILNYSPWLLGNDSAGETTKKWKSVHIRSGRKAGKTLVCHIEGYDDPETARKLIGTDIAINRDQLAATEQGEYYWSDLQGLKVETLTGQHLGTVDHLFETGANDVLVLKGERKRLIPYITGQTVIKVDLENGVMQVDWDPDF